MHVHTKNIVWNFGDKALIGKRNSKLLTGPAKLFWREFERENIKAISKTAVQKLNEDIIEKPKYRLQDVPSVKKH